MIGYGICTGNLLLSGGKGGCSMQVTFLVRGGMRGYVLYVHMHVGTIMCLNTNKIFYVGTVDPR